jgi:hypothetical protein
MPASIPSRFRPTATLFRIAIQNSPKIWNANVLVPQTLWTGIFDRTQHDRPRLTLLARFDMFSPNRCISQKPRNMVTVTELRAARRSLRKSL